MKNINIDGIKKFLDEAKNDPSLLKRKMKVEVRWNMDEKEPQMFSEIEIPSGNKVKLTCDSAPFMGGKGVAPNPLQYCLFGMASCFLATFATVAYEKGLNIKSLSITAENEINLKRPMAIADEPVVEKIVMSISVDSDESREKIEEVKKIAMERCPAVWCITNPIPLEIEIKK